MNKNRWFNAIVIVLVVGLASLAFAAAHEFDKKTYDKLAKKTIGRVISGNIDANKMLADMEKLVELGVAGCKEHMREPETPQSEVQIMKFTADNAGRMQSLTLKEIEQQWHEGGFLKAKGIDINTFDHFAEVMCHYDAVVHPATAIICLKEYKNTKNDELLEQVKAELAEVREHLKHLE